MFVLAASGGLPSWVVQLLVVFFFIVLPILRGMREAKARRKALAERAEARGGSSVETTTEPEREAASEGDDLAEARRRWEALLRGEAEPAAPAPPPVAPVPAFHRERAAETREIAPAPTAGEPVSAPLAPESPVESTFDEALQERRAAEQRVDEERRQRAELARTEHARNERLAAAPVESPAAGVEAARAPARLADSFGGRDRASRRAALRRAIVANEVLLGPLAWREPSRGPLGLGS